MEFNEKLQELRKQKGLTQEELAQTLFVSRAAVSKWESGRGYPNIDSLKAIAKYFAVSIDDLLSGDELLTIAEENSKAQKRHFGDMVFAATDLSAAMLLFMPFFGSKASEAIQAVSLFSLAGTASYLKIVYYAIAFAIVLTGVLTIALQNIRSSFWSSNKKKLSLALNTAATLLFIMGQHPYAASFILVLLAVKVFVLIKKL